MISMPTASARVADAALAEWTKLRSIRSTLWSLLAAGGICVGTGILVARSPNVPPGSIVEPGDAVKVALAGFVFGQLAICVMATLAVTGEYASGGIRTSLSAVPCRGRLLAAKTLAVAGASLVAGTLISVLSYLVADAVMTARTAQVADLSGGAVRAILGAGLYLTVLSLFAIALGVIMRHSAGALTAVICLVLIFPAVLPAFGKTGRTIYKWWPTEAGQQVMRVDATPGLLTPWTGLALFSAATAALLTVAYFVLQRRDA